MTRQANFIKERVEVSLNFNLTLTLFRVIFQANLVIESSMFYGQISENGKLVCYRYIHSYTVIKGENCTG